jgi:hypothetical protein
VGGLAAFGLRNSRLLRQCSLAIFFPFAAASGAAMGRRQTKTDVSRAIPLIYSLYIGVNKRDIRRKTTPCLVIGNSRQAELFGMKTIRCLIFPESDTIYREQNCCHLGSSPELPRLGLPLDMR